MPTKTSAGTLFKPELVTDVFSKVKGHSTLAKLCGASPMPFAGTDTFIFTMDGEASIVGESGKKPAGEADFKPVTIKPLKLVYQHRVTNEFVYLSTEKQIPYLAAFADGFAKKIARAIDIAAFHGVNPATKSDAEQVGNNCFVKAVTQSVDFDEDAPDDNIDAAVALVQGKDGVITGIAMAPAFGAALGAMKMADSHAAMYPEFRFGGNPAGFAGLSSDINNTVAFNSSDLRAVVGDFANCFRWGFAENIPMEIIPYGNPDGLGDLKETNEIVLRAEAFVGWGILDSDSFALIKESA